MTYFGTVEVSVRCDQRGSAIQRNRIVVSLWSQAAGRIEARLMGVEVAFICSIFFLVELGTSRRRR